MRIRPYSNASYRATITSGLAARMRGRSRRARRVLKQRSRLEDERRRGAPGARRRRVASAGAVAALIGAPITSTAWPSARRAEVLDEIVHAGPPRGGVRVPDVVDVRYPHARSSIIVAVATPGRTSTFSGSPMNWVAVSIPSRQPLQRIRCEPGPRVPPELEGDGGTKPAMHPSPRRACSSTGSSIRRWSQADRGPEPRDECQQAPDPGLWRRAAGRRCVRRTANCPRAPSSRSCESRSNRRRCRCRRTGARLIALMAMSCNMTARRAPLMVLREHEHDLWRERLTGEHGAGGDQRPEPPLLIQRRRTPVTTNTIPRRGATDRGRACEAHQHAHAARDRREQLRQELGFAGARKARRWAGTRGS